MRRWLWPLSMALPWCLAAQTPDTSQQVRQGVEYRIEAILNEVAETLHGRARLLYTNNSPEPLDTLFVHQYLNAFRPNSAWARRELQFGERRFQDLGPEEHAFERFLEVRVGGTVVRPVYPGAPDSTVAALPLPNGVLPGASVTVTMNWVARPSTIARRQGRRGRHYDFAQWYPRIAVYDHGGWHAHPLLPQGEFYGEFATYDVTLDLAADQIVGATGVPVEGDPGWEASLGALSGAVRYRRDAYAPRPSQALGLLSQRVETGRKRVRWRAERVHHFAWSADPDFKYEGGSYRDVAIHVLYQRDSLDWQRGAVVRRATRVLSWLEGVFGSYPYPQLTLLHRIEGGGTEFPMLVMNGGASQGLITHEVTHQYAHGILANNEWRDAWLDEGFTSFLSNWFAEDDGVEHVWRRVLEGAAEWRPELEVQPVATPAAEFADFERYDAMSYTKGAIIFYMLREYLGTNTFRQVLKAYYDRHKFTHVTESDLRHVAEEVSGEELSWFFDQWLHSPNSVDYRIGELTVEREPGGSWRTRVEVIRDGEARMPVTVQVGNVVRRLEGRAIRQLLTVVTRFRPRIVVLDPEFVIFDADRSNNRRELVGS